MKRWPREKEPVKRGRDIAAPDAIRKDDPELRKRQIKALRKARQLLIQEFKKGETKSLILRELLPVVEEHIKAYPRQVPYRDPYNPKAEYGARNKDDYIRIAKKVLMDSNWVHIWHLERGETSSVGGERLVPEGEDHVDDGTGGIVEWNRKDKRWEVIAFTWGKRFKKRNPDGTAANIEDWKELVSQCDTFIMHEIHHIIITQGWNSAQQHKLIVGEDYPQRTRGIDPTTLNSFRDHFEELENHQE